MNQKNQKKLLLIVDDEKDMVELLRMRLGTAGYEVLTAFDGEAGWGMVKKHKPDLVVLDVMMPKLSGFQVCRQMKSDATLRQIPVLMLTARGQEQDKALGEVVDADGYIVKPFDSKELLDAISKLLKVG